MIIRRVFMNRKKVYVTRMMPIEAIELLKKHFDVEINEEDRALNKEELIENAKDADGVLCTLVDIIDGEVMRSLPNVKVFSNFAVGYNNFDISEAKNRGVVITNTPGVLTDTTAELGFALLMAAARRVVEADRYTREGKFTQWTPTLFLGVDIYGKTLGILGAGRIGKAFAKRSIGFDMKILYHNRTRDMEFEKNYNATWVDKETLLKESDFISVHVPLTSETKHMIGEKEFKMMKNTAILINTARGQVVDEKALYKALKNHTIWACGLDVYENEPDLTEGLNKLDNVVLLPHIGSASRETRTNMAIMAAKNIIEVLEGRRPINPVY